MKIKSVTTQLPDSGFIKLYNGSIAIIKIIAYITLLKIGYQPFKSDEIHQKAD
jgi:hypothetical protein